MSKELVFLARNSFLLFRVRLQSDHCHHMGSTLAILGFIHPIRRKAWWLDFHPPITAVSPICGWCWFTLILTPLSMVLVWQMVPSAAGMLLVMQRLLLLMHHSSLHTSCQRKSTHTLSQTGWVSMGKLTHRRIHVTTFCQLGLLPE